MRQVHNLEQGSREWHTHRATPGMINGSEIAAIMGLSSYVTRAELVRRKATGIEPEYDAATMARFSGGHANEAAARPLAEDHIGDDLSAMVMSDTIDGVLISVSLDGITQGYDTTFEHKTLNAALAAALDAGHLPEEYEPQCEAGLMVSGATRCLFMASKGGDPETMRHFWYESKPELRPRIIAACKQFLEDVDNYQHVETAAAPVAAPIDALPALLVQVEGRVLATNLDAFKAAAQTFIDGIKTELVNDQDFADADKMVKFLKEGEEKLEAAKQHALAQTASIDELFRTIDSIGAQMKAKRLALDKLVKSEKENRRAEIVQKANVELAHYIKAINKRLGGDLMPAMPSPFADAIKGLKSLDSIRDKVSTALAHAKLAAGEIADTIGANRDAVPDELIGVLMPDFAQVCTKSRLDFANLLAARVAAHKEAEEKRLEAEREKIRQQEADRISRESARADIQAKAQAANDQRGKTEEAPEPNATARPQAPAASTLSDESIIDDYLRLKAISPAAKKELRLELVAFVKYQRARELAVAA